MSPYLPSFRTALRAATTGAAVLLGGSAVQAQPGTAPLGASQDLPDVSPADVELRRRLAPLVPTVRAALEGNNRDAQRAAIGIAADFPPAIAINARLPAVLATYLLRDGIDPELAAMGLRAYGRMSPDPTDLAKVAGRHLKAEQTEVRRAAAEALATSVLGSAPAQQKALAFSRDFADTAGAALPLLNTALEDRDGGVQRAALDGIASAARVVTDLYTFDPGPIGDEPPPKEGASRFDLLRPVTRGLAVSIPQLARPLTAPDPGTRQAAARTLETLAVTRRTVLSTRPVGEAPPADPFPEGWPALRPVLADRVKDPDPQTRLATTQAIESLGDAVDARDLLRQAAGDRVVFIRWAAARALGRTAPPKPVADRVADDVAALARLTADSDPDVRTAALTAIAKFGPAARSAADAVLTAAARGDVEPRVAAVRALGALQTEAGQTVPVLIAALRDPDLRLRRVAAAGLTRFGPDAKAALPELRQAVLSDDPELRLAAAEAILAIERVPRMKEL